ncbi:hypothetical protein [Nocardioides donggukensis]|uniref:Uncharacterized protein n=1 Tax=Nocardioides donggukensis TaxID=2774019 RepID=A0A927K9G0_9ACTN|nr:hypothetical protein [Nocardioides donggukensis]MBD8870085.1 hypothetical protein [Nocardioides donggukensis]
MGRKTKPKSRCCVSAVRCENCPLRMLEEGTLPRGYTVRHHKLVKVSRSRRARSAQSARAA